MTLGIDPLKKGRSVYFKWLTPGEWGIGSASDTVGQENDDAASR